MKLPEFPKTWTFSWILVLTAVSVICLQTWASFHYRDEAKQVMQSLLFSWWTSLKSQKTGCKWIDGGLPFKFKISSSNSENQNFCPFGKKEITSSKRVETKTSALSAKKRSDPVKGQKPKPYIMSCYHQIYISRSVPFLYLMLYFNRWTIEQRSPTRRTQFQANMLAEWGRDSFRKPKDLKKLGQRIEFDTRLELL